MMSSFLKSLREYTYFTSIFEKDAYREIPPGHTLYLTDVKNSTHAIETGMYRNVNMVGAAAITVASNNVGAEGVAYQFGGDGATLIVESKHQSLLDIEFSKLSRLAKEVFDLELRVGRVAIEKLKESGHASRILRFAIDEKQSLDMFYGEGFSVAEQWIKTRPELLIRTDLGEGNPDLSGLSCRWEPLRSVHGEMLTCLIRPQMSQNLDTLREVYHDIENIVGVSISSLAPVRAENLRLKWRPSETRFEQALKGKTKVTMEALLFKLMFKMGFKSTRFDANRYLDSLPLKTDHKKMDGVLRMVLDMPGTKIKPFLHYLETRRGHGDIYYGVHRADSAIMTCLVFSAPEDDHIHFIDGNHGGYALAAKQLKQQIKEASMKIELSPQAGRRA